MSKFTVVYDACVLYPAPLRDALMRLALNDFILYQIDMAPTLCCRAFQAQRSALKRPPLTVETFLAMLQKQQLPQTVSKLREFADFL